MYQRAKFSWRRLSSVKCQDILDSHCQDILDTFQRDRVEGKGWRLKPFPPQPELTCESHGEGSAGAGHGIEFP
jgi:hypothetical protein